MRLTESHVIDRNDPRFAVGGGVNGAEVFFHVAVRNPLV